MVTFSSQYNAVGKTGALARIKALSLSCIRRHCVSIKKKSKSLKEGPWWKTGLFFLKFCHKIGITHKTLLQHTHFCSRITVSRKKYNICVFVWVVNCTSHFFHGTSFLLERMTERQIMVFGKVSGRWFHKNEQSEFMASRKKTQYFLLMIKFELSSEKKEFQKTCAHHCELDSFPIFKIFLMNYVVTLIVNFHCMLKCVSIWKIYITQRANSFQMTNVWCYKIRHG